MTLISSIITDAYRESNMLPLGVAPNANQSAEALRLHNQNLTALYGGDAGERLVDWPLGTYRRDPQDDGYSLIYTDDRLHHPEINHRLIALNLTAATIFMPVRPQDGSRMGIADPYSRLASVPLTLDGNGRPIEGQDAIVLDTDGTFREWIYRADLAAWVRITDMLAEDENPFPPAYDVMFTVLLSMRLNPRYGRMMDPQSADVFKKNRREFIARYLQSRPLETDDSISWPFMSTQSYDTQRAFSSERGFRRGITWE